MPIETIDTITINYPVRSQAGSAISKLLMQIIDLCEPKVNKAHHAYDKDMEVYESAAFNNVYESAKYALNQIEDMIQRTNKVDKASYLEKLVKHIDAMRADGFSARSALLGNKI